MEDLSIGFNISISFHVATQAIRLRRSGFSLNTLRVTLWVATALHLDTPTTPAPYGPRPSELLKTGVVKMISSKFLL